MKKCKLLKTHRYYPEKTKTGFKIVKTFKSGKCLGFAVFKNKQKAKSSGERWYGK